MSSDNNQVVELFIAGFGQRHMTSTATSTVSNVANQNTIETPVTYYGLMKLFQDDCNADSSERHQHPLLDINTEPA